MTSYDGQSITYDAIGNPLSYYNGQRYTMTWSNGRQLDQTKIGKETINYTYDADGQRRSKTRSGYYTDEYVYYGTQLSTLIRNGVGYKHSLTFIYDDAGQALGFYYDTNLNDSNPGTKYYYVCNAQGDVLQLRDHTNAPVANYYYDAWGKLLGITDANGNAITAFNSVAVLNPIRYRGYFYDTETGFYYLNSRYYDPQIGRWISPEPNVDQGGFDSGAGFLGYNVYAYCANNPIMFKDETGESITLACVLIFGGIGLLTGGHFAAKASKAKLGYVNGWWVLGGMVVGGGVGALLGWGVGSAATAIGVKLAAGSSGTLGKVIYSSWQSAENALRTAYNGAKVTFNTPWGKRIIDSYSKNVIREAKYGYQGLSKFIQQEINKDVWILKNTSVKSIEWHFYWSTASNSGGASGPLLKELARYGIKVIFH